MILFSKNKRGRLVAPLQGSGAISITTILSNAIVHQAIKNSGFIKIS